MKGIKIVKVGHYRMFFILASVASLVFFGASQNLIVLAGAIGVIATWVIFEINVVLQAVLGVQRMFAYLIQQMNALNAERVEKTSLAAKLIEDAQIEDVPEDGEPLQDQTTNEA